MKTQRKSLIFYFNLFEVIPLCTIYSCSITNYTDIRHVHVEKKGIYSIVQYKGNNVYITNDNIPYPNTNKSAADDFKNIDIG